MIDLTAGPSSAYVPRLRPTCLRRAKALPSEELRVQLIPGEDADGTYVFEYGLHSGLVDLSKKGFVRVRGKVRVSV